MDEITAKRLDELQKQVDYLLQKRITQVDVVPGSIKQRAMGEANLWVNAGLAADLPSEGLPTAEGTSIYFETDTGVLNIWNGTAWLSTTLT